MIRVHEAITVA